MSEKIIFATGNAGKLKEIREILKDLNREIVTMREAGFEGEIEENGTTFRENAEIKAKAVWEKTGGIVLADDSGLVIDYLNGEPGVYSARYLGDTPYEEKNRILIERMKDAKGKERSARFMCNIAAVLPDGRVLHTEAAMEGEIAKEAAGNGGFGYDPILWLPEYGKTSAELTMEEKNRISHRVFVMPKSPKLSSWKNRDDDGERTSLAAVRWENILNKVLALDYDTEAEEKTPHVLSMDREAREYFFSWWNRKVERINQIEDDAEVDSREMKHPAHVARLALIIQVLRHASGESHLQFIDVSLTEFQIFSLIV